ncbi:DNA-formamidopyrimidine glycosylase family protein, partial [Streptomyces sp. NPDC059558]|uniref:DNA-formamidopyrimidine glycosylase family protein n=1 Tax=Streptomyces sp. NPDC059558 TaxID=3346864 RepID=UPI0036A94083
MPELPEVEALREYLDEHLTGRVVERVLPLAVSVLKTYDPPLTALEGQPAGTTPPVGRVLGGPGGGHPHGTPQAPAGGGGGGAG